ncbi:MAG: xanthine dehydrogenase family protein subunit M [Rhodospirillales bacterium]
MKPAKFDYHAPTTVEEVLDLLAQHGTEAKLLAGGQSFVPVLNFRLARPAVVIDLNRVDGLAFIEERGDTVAIGAMTRQRRVERSEVVARRLPLLHDATRWIGHLPIRTRGTIGGSVANADPAAEDPAVVRALDATMVVRSRRGERKVPAADYFRGLLTTAIEPDELLCAIEFPVAPPGAGATFAEISRRHGDFALAGVGAQLVMAGGRVGEVRLAACGVGPGPVRLAAAEAIVARDGLTEKAMDAAADAAASEVAPSGDVHASADYRRRLTRAMTRQALAAAAARATGARA